MIETDMSRLTSVYWSTGWLPTEPKLDFVIDNPCAPGSWAAAGAAITPVSSRTATPQRSTRMISPLAQRIRAGRVSATRTAVKAHACGDRRSGLAVEHAVGAA